MTLAPPTFLMAHAVLGFSGPLSRAPAQSEILAAALREAFPNVVARPYLTQDVPAQTPHLTLASTSSQLAVSAFQADFEVRFYGDYLTDVPRSLDYVEAKLLAVLHGLRAIETVPSLVGLIGTFHFAVDGAEDGVAAGHILDTHLQTSVDRSAVADALVRVAVRVRDTYFVSLTLGNYEFRTFERPIMPGMQQIRLSPWEGKVQERGLELTLDINNNLEGRTLHRDPVVTEQGVRAVTRLLRDVALTTGPTFAESGVVDVPSLTASVTI